jgi:XTP/dITP diphosphohydrolase
VWLVADDGDDELTAALAPLIAQRADDGTAPELEVVHGSFDVPGARLLDLVAVMDRLRSPGGCPWDAEQTHASLARYLLEETYETLEALDNGDLDHLREELGDLLLQVVFHARVAEENTDRPWSIDDVAAGIVEKLVSRHPHVFGDAATDTLTPTEVESNWETMKAAEKGRKSPVDGVPMTLPALALATKLLDRVVSTGGDVAVEEPELPDDLTAEQLGVILFGLVSAARRQGLDPESALRRQAHLFTTNFHRERRVQAN